MTPAQYCRRKTLAASSSFFLPFFFLPPPRRAAMYAVYAFCREVDDIVDSGLPIPEAARQLEAWQQELQQAFAGHPTHPITLELAHYQPLFELPTQPFYDILAGMAMDLQQNRYQTLDDLLRYCYRVAVTVGIIAVRIFVHGRTPVGWEEGRERLFAQQLGMALQLTNIVRDVAEDARMGRIYLPQHWMASMGVASSDILQHRWTPALGELLRQLADLAEGYYRGADEWMTSPQERQILRPALFMGAIYHTRLQRLRQDGFHCFGALRRFSLLEKAGIIWQAWRREEARLPGGGAPDPTRGMIPLDPRNY
ncbi:MAG: presqualene diphosphate synthase HpnD [Magnetococcales bacterium]|nr:presqualene diphosphate synthase HpnD [Magnetococcales bacterium]